MKVNKQQKLETKRCPVCIGRGEHRGLGGEDMPGRKCLPCKGIGYTFPEPPEKPLEPTPEPFPMEVPALPEVRAKRAYNRRTVDVAVEG